MKIISAEQINNALNYPDLIDHLDQGFSRPFNMPKRQVFNINPGTENKDAFAVLPAWNEDYLAVKAFTYFPSNYRHNKSALHSNILLFNRSHGEPLALLEGASLTHWRTAAVSALASRYLSNPDASRLLLLGTGNLAPHLIAAHLSVRPIDSVIIWGRNTDKAQALATGLSEKFRRVNFSVHLDVKPAAQDSDIIVAATASPAPVLYGNWVAPGTHVDLLGNHNADQRECDSELIGKAQVFVDSKVNVLNEAGELLIPIHEGVFSEQAILAELSQLCNKSIAGRQSLSPITLFKSVGTAISDLLAAQYVFEKLS
ncbi:ornithine cyclodeaminase family protein [Simiduia curdlanivorans]|uniref:Ornithine cyclodeaminase family protein n=1 Tax=Simiduia curdlanivorans TaxID=1492769 RepID=A0ABV8V1S9_9GAMM|nr:ornithine cyclodeaminase family protein [Simiduia curdlanivorans]MDN3640072.1 ornithine cyclodeaminase family protein [Simiduia curdlanivorans]